MSKKHSLPIMLTWSVPEFIIHERGVWWYVWAIIIALSLLAYAVFTANFLFALIIFMAALIILLHRNRTPSLMTVTFDGTGITLGTQHYSYSEVKSFWITYEPPEVKTIHILLRSAFRPRLVIQLGEQDPSLVRNFLKQYVEEDLDEETEPLSDTLSRVLKL